MFRRNIASAAVVASVSGASFFVEQKRMHDKVQKDAGKDFDVEYKHVGGMGYNRPIEKPSTDSRSPRK
jgi:hypothetical protein